MVIPGPSCEDLKRDNRYALHSETFPPPSEDDGFYITGRVDEVNDARVDHCDRRPVLRGAAGDGQVAGLRRPGFLSSCSLDRALLTLTAERDGFARARPSGALVEV